MIERERVIERERERVSDRERYIECVYVRACEERGRKRLCGVNMHDE